MTKVEVALFFEVGYDEYENQPSFDERLKGKCSEEEYADLRELAEEFGIIENEQHASLDSTLREKVFKCTEQEYSAICETMEELGYFGVRLYPFCAKAKDDEGLEKALRWISENSELIKSLNEEYNPNIHLGVKFLVGDSLAEALGFDAGSPLQLSLSPDDFELLKEHEIELRVTAEYTEGIDD